MYIVLEQCLVKTSKRKHAWGKRSEKKVEQ